MITKGEPDKAFPSPDETLKPGQLIGDKYQVHHKLGEGGFGMVYLALNRGTGELVALKTFRDELLADAGARRAFKKEALLWVGLDEHPFILAARWAEEFSGRLFVSMDYIAPDDCGRTSLQDHLVHSSGPLPMEQILEWAIQFCHGMEHAEAHGIKCHRDIKPGNILITHERTVKVADFGLAAAAESAWRGRPLARGAYDNHWGSSVFETEGRKICGTVGYIAPEVLHGIGANTRSDLYSFGIVLWQMATGSPFSPFHAGDVQRRGDDEAWLMEYQKRVYEKQMSGHVPHVGGELGLVIEGCLVIDPVKRCRDFRILRDKLEPLCERSGTRALTPEVGPKTVPFWNNKGASLDHLGRHEEAIACFDRALRLDSRCAAAWLNKGVSLHRLGRDEEAISCFDKTIEIDPHDAGGWNNRGVSLRTLGRDKEAVQCFDQAIRLDHENATNWFNMGNSLNRLRRYDEAISCYEEAVKIDPLKAEVWTILGLSLFRQGRYEAAIRCYDETLRVNPLDSDAWETKGTCLLHMHRCAESIQCLDKALEIHPRHSETWHTKALAEEGTGDRRRAIVTWRNYLAVARNDPSQQNQIPDVVRRLEELERVETRWADPAQADDVREQQRAQQRRGQEREAQKAREEARQEQQERDRRAQREREAEERDRQRREREEHERQAAADQARQKQGKKAVGREQTEQARRWWREHRYAIVTLALLVLIPLVVGVANALGWLALFLRDAIWRWWPR